MSEPDSQAPPLHELGEYLLLEKLGEGGMGTVYKARQTRLKKIVALKVLSKERTTDPRAVTRFEREMEAVGQLVHPNIVQAFDARDIETTTVLVMEYVDGQDLTHVLKCIKPLRIPDACELIRQAAVGLQYAHEHGLVHRDIKPSNLMLTRQGEVKILDLGLALLNMDQPRGGELTSSGQPMGTADYIAPEQVSDAHSVDIRADIYSLGCTLYKLLAGNSPFSGPQYKTHAEKLVGHLKETPTPVQQLRTDVSAELAAVIERMMAKSPADRFATPVEVAAAMAPFAAGCDLVQVSTEVSAAAKAAETLERAVAITDSDPRDVHGSPHRPLGEGRGDGGSAASPPRRRWRLALAAGGAAAAIFLGIVFLVSTGKGTVKLEFADADAAKQCTVSIDGDEIRIEKLGEPIKLRPGKHQLRILRGDLEIEAREFNVLWRGTQVLHVSIPARPGEIAAAGSAGAIPHGNFYAGQAQAFASSEDFDGAIAAYTEAIQQEPKVAEYYIGRGEAYFAKGQYGLAIANFGEAIRLDPTRADAHVARGAAYVFEGDASKASADFKEVARAKSDCGQADFHKAAVYRRMGRNVLAMNEYRKATCMYHMLVEADKRYLDLALRDLRQLVREKDGLGPTCLHWVSCWLPAATRGPSHLPGTVFASDMPWVQSTCGYGPSSAVRNKDWGNFPLFLDGLPYAKGIWTHPFDDSRGADVVIDIGSEKFSLFKADVGLANNGTVQFQVLVDGKLKNETPVLRLGDLQSICVDVAGGKQIVLRVLNGGDGNGGDASAWGFPRFVQAGAEDPLEEPPAELHSATDANAALFLAEVHWRLDHRDLARRWFDKATGWIDKHAGEAEKLRQYQAEAGKLFGIPETPSPAKQQPEKAKHQKP